MTKKPETMEAVRAMVAGDLGKEMEKYPLRFASSAYFGAPPHRNRELVVSSGSASLVRLNGKPYVITCSHVLQGYRKGLAEDSGCIFQIGDCKLDPIGQLVDENSKLDVAVIGLATCATQGIPQSSRELTRIKNEPHDSPWSIRWRGSPLVAAPCRPRLD